MDRAASGAAAECRLAPVGRHHRRPSCSKRVLTPKARRELYYGASGLAGVAQFTRYVPPSFAPASTATRSLSAGGRWPGEYHWSAKHARYRRGLSVASTLNGCDATRAGLPRLRLRNARKCRDSSRPRADIRQSSRCSTRTARGQSRRVGRSARSFSTKCDSSRHERYRASSVRNLTEHREPTWVH